MLRTSFVAFFYPLQFAPLPIFYERFSVTAVAAAAACGAVKMCFARASHKFPPNHIAIIKHAHLIFIVSSSEMVSLLFLFLVCRRRCRCGAIGGAHTIGTDFLRSVYRCTCMTLLRIFRNRHCMHFFSPYIHCRTYDMHVHLSHLRGACKCMPQKWEKKIKFKCETPTNVSKARNDWNA